MTIMNTKIYKMCISCLLSFFMWSGSVSAGYSGWGDRYMDFCVSRGIISGDENGNLMPENNLLREQMVKMILNSLSVDIVSSEKVKYDDIDSERWSYPYISKYQEYDLRNTEDKER